MCFGQLFEHSEMIELYPLADTKLGVWCYKFGG